MRPYWKITLWYCAFGLSWILVTDFLSMAVAPGIHELVYIQICKGWFYVALSAGLIFSLTRRAFLEQARVQAEKLEVLRSSVGNAHHILLNYLNQMQLVTLEAEKVKDFDPEILSLSHQVSEEATRELMKLAKWDTAPGEAPPRGPASI